MLSTFPQLLLNSYPVFEIPIDGGFTPWECPNDPFSPFHSPEPVVSNSGSDFFQSPKLVVSGSDSDYPNPNLDKPSPNLSQDPDETELPNFLQASAVDELKRRRMISNRESARRSRVRKQRHLENLRNQVNRLKVENQDLSNRLRFLLFYCHSARTENDRLQSEHRVLRQKFSDIRQILIFRQLQKLPPALPYSNSTPTIISEQITPPIIT